MSRVKSESGRHHLGPFSAHWFWSGGSLDGEEVGLLLAGCGLTVNPGLSGSKSGFRGKKIGEVYPNYVVHPLSIIIQFSFGGWVEGTEPIPAEVGTPRTGHQFITSLTFYKKKQTKKANSCQPPSFRFIWYRNQFLALCLKRDKLFQLKVRLLALLKVSTASRIHRAASLHRLNHFNLTLT